MFSIVLPSENQFARLPDLRPQKRYFSMSK